MKHKEQQLTRFLMLGLFDTLCKCFKRLHEKSIHTQKMKNQNKLPKTCQRESPFYQSYLFFSIHQRSHDLLSYLYLRKIANILKNVIIVCEIVQISTHINF